MAFFTGRQTGAFAGTISFDWYPDPDVVAMELIQTAENLEDRSVPLALSRLVAQQEHLEHFETQSGPDGEAWRPWASSYEPIARATNAGEILERTLALEEAMVEPSAYPITQDSVFFSTAGLPEYWLWNQEGTGSFSNWGARDDIIERTVAGGLPLERNVGFGIGKGSALPARPFIGMSVEAQLKILEIFDLWFNNAVTSVFARRGKVVLAEHQPSGAFSGSQVVI